MLSAWWTALAVLVVAAASLTCDSSGVCSELRPEFIAGGQWIVADMDGTLIGAPDRDKEPTLLQSNAMKPFLEYLGRGGQVVMLTGCETERVKERFLQYLPYSDPALKKALKERRFWIATNGGAVMLFYDGTQWVEETDYRDFMLGLDDNGLPLRIVMPLEKVSIATNNAVEFLNRFYLVDLQDAGSHLRTVLQNHSDKAFQKRLEEIAETRITNGSRRDWTLDELNTLNPSKVPRIEMRNASQGDVVQICVIGIPTELKYPFGSLLHQLQDAFEVVPISWTHEIDIKGVTKVLPLKWAENHPEKYPPMKHSRSVAIGDRPDQNDQTLTELGMPFISVACLDRAKKAARLMKNVTFEVDDCQNGTALIFNRLNTIAGTNPNGQVIPITLSDGVIPGRILRDGAQ